MKTLLCLIPQRSAGYLLPLYKYIPAGDPSSSFEVFMHGKSDLNALLFGNHEALVFYVQGQVEEGFDLEYGDLVVVHTKLLPRQNDIILLQDQEELKIKHFTTLQEGIVGVLTSVIKFQKKIFTDYHIQQLIENYADKPFKEKDSYPHPPVDLNKVLIRNPASTYFIEVIGDSMKDDRIYNGDIVIVDKSILISNKDIIAARINGDVTLKRFEFDLRPKLAPSNPAFKKIDIPYHEKSVTDGVVIATIERWRKV